MKKVFFPLLVVSVVLINVYIITSSMKTASAQSSVDTYTWNGIPVTVYSGGAIPEELKIKINTEVCPTSPPMTLFGYQSMATITQNYGKSVSTGYTSGSWSGNASLTAGYTVGGSVGVGYQNGSTSNEVTRYKEMSISYSEACCIPGGNIECNYVLCSYLVQQAKQTIENFNGTY